MGTVTFSKPTCAGCGKEIDESPHLSPQDRKPCLSCGSLKRNFAISIYETLTMRGSLGYKGKRPGLKRPFIEGFSGAKWSSGLKKWIDKIQIFDRDGDHYEEKITDPETGEVLHHTKEKLSQHIGHGSARFKRNN